MLAIVDDQLDQSWPELEQDLKERVEHPAHFGSPEIAPLPDGWLIDWGDWPDWSSAT